MIQRPEIIRELRTMEEAVRQFQVKHGFAVRNWVTFNDGENLKALSVSLQTLVDENQDTANEYQTNDDPRTYRGLAKVEEIAELFLAMANNNREKVADALGDLLYFICGTAIMYDVPLDAVFSEIHRSNMTKIKRDEHDDPRMRDKGSNFVKADIAAVLKRWDNRPRLSGHLTTDSEEQRQREKDVLGDPPSNLCSICKELPCNCSAGVLYPHEGGIG